MLTGLSRLIRLFELMKAQEARDRLDYIGDVSCLFNKHAEKHINRLTSQAEMCGKKKPELKGTAPGGGFIPGKSYIVE
jgi:hypothetical protein